MGTVHTWCNTVCSLCSSMVSSICQCGNNNNAQAANNNNTPRFKWKEYNKELKYVKRIAVGTNVFYGLNRFLGVCALTWATTIILGGIVEGINRRDYYLVAILLLLETIRFACARFFGYLVTRYKIYATTEPNRLNYNDHSNVAWAEGVRILGQFVLLIVLGISIVIPVRALRSIHYATANSSNFHSIEASLRIFYIIVVANAIIAALGVLYARTVVYLYISPDSHSLHKYYDTIVWNGLSKGLLECTEFDILQFAFQSQADEYRHNKRAPMVKYLYGNLMLYLYDHPNHKGFEAAKVALDSEDVFVREAAANIVGCWVKLKSESNTTGAPDIEGLLLQKKLLEKLASALEHEETGRAASYSFEALALQKPDVIAKVESESGEKLSCILMKRIHEVVDLGKFDKALVFIKALIPILPHMSSAGLESSSSESMLAALNELLKHTYNTAICGSSSTSASPSQHRSLFDNKLRQEIETLHGDLKTILSWTPLERTRRPLTRTIAVAAKALHIIYQDHDLETLLITGNKMNGSDIVDSLMREPEPRLKQHVLTEEWEYFKDAFNGFRSQNQVELTAKSGPADLWPQNGSNVEYREISDTYNLPWWLKNMKTISWLVAALMLFLMGTGVSLIINYIP